MLPPRGVAVVVLMRVRNARPERGDGALGGHAKVGKAAPSFDIVVQRPAPERGLLDNPPGDNLEQHPAFFF